VASYRSPLPVFTSVTVTTYSAGAFILQTGRLVGRQMKTSFAWPCLLDRRALCLSVRALVGSIQGVGDVRVSVCMPSAACVTLKCLPREKSTRGEVITDLICLPLLKCRRLHKNLPIIGSPLPRKVFSRLTIYRQKFARRDIGRSPD